MSAEPFTVEPVPLVDLSIQRDRVAGRVLLGMDRVLSTTSFVLGPEVDAFEREYAAYCGVGHCVGVANGTDALELSLTATGIGRGDEVILPANTFFATLEAVIRAGASPVLVDCDEDLLVAPEAVRKAVTPRTAAVVAVHLHGRLAPVEELRTVVGDGVLIVEDAAQSQGATGRGARSGGLGDIAATSFYPGKNLGAYGDAGAVTTGSDVWAGRLRQLRNHGGSSKYDHVLVGTNSRLDSLQAVVLRAKLEVLDEWNAERRVAAERYDGLLGSLSAVTRPGRGRPEEHVWHLYVVQVANRDAVLARLQASGIGAGVHYPKPLHLTKAMSYLGLQPGTFPEAERAASRILSLPMFPGITPIQQERVVEALGRALS